jgi:uncharacterized protein (DUF697 family)/GTP-binding protein EngB required for normal cell division
VVGGTGVGKSALINRIFGYDIAKTGAGKPVTTGMHRYEPANSSLVFFDTEGYEVAKDGSQNRTNFETNIIPEIEKMNSGKLKDQIHLVWYCISITNHRVTEYDKLNIQYFVSRKMKTAIVFTQCDNDEELSPGGKGKDASAFQAEIEKSIPGLSFFETCANKKELLLDLEKLGEWSVQELPNEQLRCSFIASQKMSIADKKDRAREVVNTFSITTGLSGAFNPIPISDGLVIAPQQFAMCVAITRIFWLNTPFSSMIMEVLKMQLISLIGKTTASSLLKFFPLIGQVINGVVAASITKALGEILIEGNAKALEEFLNTGKEPDWLVIFHQ